MKRFSAGTDIDASPAAVWAVLVETSQWPRFDPQTEKVEGQLALGETLTVYSRLAPGQGLKVKVTTLEPPRQMAWTGGLPLGMLKHVRTHTLTPRGTGSRFEMEEVISGPMERAVPDLAAVFEDFCQGLRAAAEQKPGAAPVRPAAAITHEPERFLQMTRRFAAAPERVFDAWLNPALARQWLFVTPHDEAYAAQLDPRTGGAWTITAKRAGTDYTARGAYVEIDRPRRLVFTFAMPQFSSNTDTITVEIAPDGAGCLLTLTQRGMDIAAEVGPLPAGVKSGSELGWEDMFDRLTGVLG